MNEACKCDEPGKCERHGIEKSLRQWELCKGLNCTPEQCVKYWDHWERGRAHDQAGPVEQPAEAQIRGLGDRLSNAIYQHTGVKSCGGCKDRAARLNHHFSEPPPPVEPVKFSEPRRHFLMHIWPASLGNAWRWNCDQVKRRADLFNGRRIIAIARGPGCDTAEAVKEYMADFTDEFIVMQNRPKFREVVTFVPLLEQLEDYISRDELTFYCHSKCSRHRIQIEDNTTIVRWTDAMYRICLDDWATVQRQLTLKAMTGCFKRYGDFKTRHNNRWHYSGTFYWFRNRDVYQRNWRYIDRRFFGAESWPGHMFRPEETDCLFLDDAQNLYEEEYWQSTVGTALKEWRHEHESLRSEQGARTLAGP